RQSRSDIPRVLTVDREVLRAQGVLCKSSWLDEGRVPRERAPWRSCHARELHEHPVGEWTADRAKPAVVHPKLQLMPTLDHCQVVDEIELPPFVGPYLALCVLSGAGNQKEEAAIR